MAAKSTILITIASCIKVSIASRSPFSGFHYTQPGARSHGKTKAHRVRGLLHQHGSVLKGGGIERNQVGLAVFLDFQGAALGSTNGARLAVPLHAEVIFHLRYRKTQREILRIPTAGFGHAAEGNHKSQR